MALSLKGRTVLVIGRGSGIARAVVLAARSEGANVVVAGRSREALRDAYDDPGIEVEDVDLNDDASIAALAERLGEIDHLVSTASARARGHLAELDRGAVLHSFDTKVVGPIMLAKYFSGRIAEGVPSRSSPVWPRSSR